MGALPRVLSPCGDTSTRPPNAGGRRKYPPLQDGGPPHTQGLLDNSIRLELEFDLPYKDPVPLPGASILQGLLDAEPFQKACELHHRVLLIEVDATDRVSPIPVQ